MNEAIQQADRVCVQGLNKSERTDMSEVKDFTLQAKATAPSKCKRAKGQDLHMQRQVLKTSEGQELINQSGQIKTEPYAFLKACEGRSIDIERLKELAEQMPTSDNNKLFYYSTNKRIIVFKVENENLRLFYAVFKEKSNQRTTHVFDFAKYMRELFNNDENIDSLESELNDIFYGYEIAFLNVKEKNIKLNKSNAGQANINNKKETNMETLNKAGQRDEEKEITNESPAKETEKAPASKTKIKNMKINEFLEYFNNTYRRSFEHHPVNFIKDFDYYLKKVDLVRLHEIEIKLDNTNKGRESGESLIYDLRNEFIEKTPNIAKLKKLAESLKDEHQCKFFIKIEPNCIFYYCVEYDIIKIYFGQYHTRQYNIIEFINLLKGKVKDKEKLDTLKGELDFLHENHNIKTLTLKEITIKHPKYDLGNKTDPYIILQATQNLNINPKRLKELAEQMPASDNNKLFYYSTNDDIVVFENENQNLRLFYAVFQK